MTTIRQLLHLLVPYRRLLALLVVVATGVVVIEGVGLGVVFLLLGLASVSDAQAQLTQLNLPWVGDIGQTMLAMSLKTRVYVAAGALVCITLLRSLLRIGEQALSLRLRRLVERDLQVRLFQRFHELSLDALQREPGGAWMTLLRQYTRQVGDLTFHFGEVISNGVVLIGYVVLAFWVSWQLTLICLVVIAPAAMVLRPLMGARLRRASLHTREMLRATQSMAQEHLRTMKVIRLFGQQAWSRALFAENLNNYLNAEFRAGALRALAQPLFAFFSAVSFALVLVLGLTLLPGSPEVVLAQLVLFLTIGVRLVTPMSTYAVFQTQITQNTPMVQAVLEILAADLPLAPVSGDVPFTGLRTGIEFRQVAFAYEPEGALVLRGINLQIPRGQVTAIVGTSGGGKSSLVNLVARLYDPTAGQILVDGTDLREFDLVAWHRAVAVVSQEVMLFHATVWENLRFARLDATDEEIVHACKLALCHDFIMALPQGYATPLQEEGLRISGGQRQRIALARALLAHADLLVLDEATSEIDSITEQAIQQTVRDYAQEHTVLVIAHRLSNVVEADTIYVMKDGQIIEQGTHPALVQNAQVYAQMVQAQQL